MVALEICWGCEPEPYDASQCTLGSLFEGSRAIGHLREECPTWVARLLAEGRLSGPLVTPRLVPLCVLYFRVGYVLIALGLSLLMFGPINVSLLTLDL